MRLLCLCLLLSSVATTVAAQAHPPVPARAAEEAPKPAQGEKAATRGPVVDAPAPTVVLVMESAGGLRAAAELRKALNAAGWGVLSLTEAKRRAIAPDALITVAAGGSQTLQVVYWDREGTPDALSAPSPGTAEQLHAVLVALSSVLMERHRVATGPMGREVLARTRLFEELRAPARAYAMLTAGGRLHPRTNVFLRYEEF